MLWSVYLPAASLLFFFVFMLVLSLRALSSLRTLSSEIDQLTGVVEDLKANRTFGEPSERWLGDTYSYITQGSFRHGNPLVELVNRFYAMSDMASPDLSGALSSISEREMDKLELARETPSSLLLLGILGTVVGMIVAFSTFSAVDLQEGAGLDFGRIIGPAFLAFISTGIALFLSLILRALTERVAIRQGDMLAEFESYAFTHLAPLLLPKQDRALQRQFHELMERQQTLIGASLDRSAETLSAFSSTITGAQEVTRDLNEAMKANTSSLSGVGERITGDLTKVNEQMSAQLLETLRMIGEDLSEQRSALDAVAQEARSALEEEKRATLQQAETLRRNALSASNLVEVKTNELVKSIDSMTSRLTAQSAEQTAAVRDLRDELTTLSERLVESQERYQQTFLQTVQAFLQEQFEEIGRSLGLRRRN